MNRYLLLRDNKQSGPYTVTELVEKGLKPYDLVWLDGRSAAWRYPSEIEELKAFAPTVEEQPYDRFYKKPTAEKKEFQQNASRVTDNSAVSFVNPAYISQSTPSEARQPVLMQKSPAGETAETFANNFVSREAANTPAVMAEVQKPESVNPNNTTPIAIINVGSSVADTAKSLASDSGKSLVADPLPRKIYVTLPGNIKPHLTHKQVPPVQTHTTSDIESRYMPVPAAAAVPGKPAVSTPGGNGGGTGDYPNSQERPFNGSMQGSSGSKYVSVESRENSFSAKLSVDDPYTDKPYTDKVAPISKIPVIPVGRFNWAITAIAAICLLLGGVIIGLVISNRNQAAKVELDQLVNQIRERDKSKSAVVTANATVPESPQTNVSDVDANTTASLPAEGIAQPVVIKEGRTDKLVQKAGINGTLNTADRKQVDEPIAAVVVEEKPVAVRPAVNSEERAVNNVAAETARKNIRQLVSVVNNKYKTGVLGGISDLTLTVTNKSDFELDQVEVEVEYLGPEKRVVKKQIIVFSNVKPGKNLTQEVPRTNRGVTVNTAIRSINSKSLGLASTGL